MTLRFGRQSMFCPFCLKKRWFLFTWTYEGRSVKACVRHTRHAWRFLSHIREP